MKKLFFIALLISTLSAANAQQTHFGLKGGVNVSQLNVENNSSYDSKIGLFAGVLAHIHASETWALQPELIYSMEGGRRKTGDIKTNLNYINVPVLLQYMFHNGVRLEGGPQLGFLVSAKTKTGSTTVDNSSFKSTAFSIPLGIGYLTSDGLGFDARYVFGLSNINKDKNPVVQSNVFQFGIFYQFSDVKRH
ncbi:MAG: porin family protein [Ginsengibacter sp.]